MRVLGLDLGGTNVKTAVVEVDDDGAAEVVVHGSGPTDALRGPEAVAQRMVDLGAQAVEQHGPVAGVGVGVPGLFDFDGGEIVFFTNLPGPWEGFPLRSRIADGLGLPASLINDARAFTLAEGTVGAARGCRSMVGLTLGTGVGGGVMIEGKLLFGAFGVAGEIGHQTIDPDGPVCGCGNPGCLEAFTRGPVIAAAAGTDSVEEAIAGMVAGDPRCRSALEAAIDHLAVGLANVVTVIGPERIVIGGGIAEAGDVLLDPIRAAVRERVTLVPPEQVDIVPAELGSAAGAIGAALAALGSPVGDRRFLQGEIPSAVRRREES